jgi:DNA-binding PadR family transcriptional regulator
MMGVKMEIRMTTSRQDWLLLALALRGGLPMSPVQIQKTMFLMSAEAKEYLGQGFYKFVPYNYGPFASDVYTDLESLASRGLVTSSVTGRGWKIYAITPVGLTAGEKIKASANATAVAFLKRVVDWVCSLSFPALLRAIYAKYPKYKANSVFTG